MTNDSNIDFEMNSTHNPLKKCFSLIPPQLFYTTDSSACASRPTSASAAPGPASVISTMARASRATSASAAPASSSSSASARNHSRQQPLPGHQDRPRSAVPIMPQPVPGVSNLLCLTLSESLVGALPTPAITPPLAAPPAGARKSSRK